MTQIHPIAKDSRNPFIPRNIILLLLSTSLLGFFVVLFDLPFILVPVGVFSFACALLLSQPLFLLSLLIIVRMSLDIFGDTHSITIGKYLALTLSQSLGIAVALLGTLSLFILRRSLSKIPLTAPLVLVLLWGFCSLLFSIDPGATARELLRVFDLLTLFALAFAAIHTKNDLRIILQAFFLSSIVPISIGIYQYIFHIGFRDESVNIPRIFGTFSHPNIFSLYLFSMIALSFLFFTLYIQSQREKTLSGLLALFYATILFITYTRIAWISLFVFLLLLAVFHFRKLLFPLIIIPIILFLAIAPFQERFLDSFRASPDSSVTWRLVLWKDTVGATIAKSNALFGSGMNTFPIVSENIRGISQGPSNDPHNDFVKFFVEGGVIGLAVFLFYIGKTAWSLLRNFFSAQKEERRVAFLILFAFFSSLTLASLSDNIFKNTPVQWIFWITLGAALKIFSDRTVPEKEKSAIPVLRK